jgi:hypothetical protein
MQRGFAKKMQREAFVCLASSRKKLTAIALLWPWWTERNNKADHNER